MPKILDGVTVRTLRSKTSGIGSLAPLETPCLLNPRVEAVQLRARPLPEGGSLDTLQRELPVP